MAQRGRHETVRTRRLPQPGRIRTAQGAGSAGTGVVILAALVGLLLGIGGAAVFHATRSDSSSAVRAAATRTPATRTSRTPPATNSVLGAASGAVAPGLVRDCRRAVQRADSALAQAGRVQSSLTQQTNIVNQLLGHSITLPQALHTSVPLLATGSSASTLLQEAETRYRAAAKLCTS